LPTCQALAELHRDGGAVACPGNAGLVCPNAGGLHAASASGVGTAASAAAPASDAQLSNNGERKGRFICWGSSAIAFTIVVLTSHCINEKKHF